MFGVITPYCNPIVSSMSLSFKTCSTQSGNLGGDHGGDHDGNRRGVDYRLVAP